MKNLFLVLIVAMLSCQKTDRELPGSTSITEREIKFANEHKTVDKHVAGEVRFKLWDNSSLKFVAGRSTTKHILTKAMERAGDNGVYKIYSGNVEQTLQGLRSNLNVQWAELNYTVKTQGIPDDTYWNNGSLWGMLHINANQAWASGNFGSKQVVAAVVDEGIFSHDDLCGNIWRNPYELDNGIDDDGNGYIDDFNGWNWYNGNNQIYMGGDRHGTHVAGTIGGKGGNQIGVVGVSPNVTIISCKFLQGSGSTEHAALALDYLVDLKQRHGINIKVTNNSWGGGGYAQMYIDAVHRARDAGILNVYAAGNSNNNNDLDASPSFPGAYSYMDSSMITVIASDWQNNKASFSSYGQNTAHIAAPGTGIVSTVPTAQHTSGYDFFGGTSMAAPHVTGALCLYYAINPNATATQAKAALLNSATSLPQLLPYCRNGKFLNVGSFLGQTAEIQPPFYECPVFTPDANPPSTPQNFRIYDMGFDPTPGGFYGGYVGLEWLPSIDPDGSPVGYIILANDIGLVFYTSTQNPVRIAIAGIDTTQQPIVYKVYAVDNWGNVSGMSNSDTAIWNGSQPPPPPPPPVVCTITSNLSATSVGLNVTVTFGSTSNCEIGSRVLQRKKGINGNYQTIQNATSPYNETLQTPGHYYYKFITTLVNGQVDVKEIDIQVKKK
jgi:subtilisin family serine protease